MELKTISPIGKASLSKGIKVTGIRIEDELLDLARDRAGLKAASIANVVRIALGRLAGLTDDEILERYATRKSRRIEPAESNPSS